MISLQHPCLDVTSDTSSFPQTGYITSYYEIILQRKKGKKNFLEGVEGGMLYVVNIQ
jgi:hypothetical protein